MMVWLVAVGCGVAALSVAVALLRQRPMHLAVVVSPALVALVALGGLTAGAWSPRSHASWRTALSESLVELASAAMVMQILGGTLVVTAGAVAVACAVRGMAGRGRHSWLPYGLTALGAVMVLGIGFMLGDADHANLLAVSLLCCSGVGVLGAKIDPDDASSSAVVGPAAALLTLFGVFVTMGAQTLMEVLELWTTIGFEQVVEVREPVGNLVGGRDGLSVLALATMVSAVGLASVRGGNPRLLRPLGASAALVSVLLFLVWGLPMRPLEIDASLREAHLEGLAGSVTELGPRVGGEALVPAPVLRATPQGQFIGTQPLDSATPGPALEAVMVPFARSAPNAALALTPSLPWRASAMLRRAAEQAGAAQLQWVVANPGGRLVAVVEQAQTWQSHEGPHPLVELILADPEVTLTVETTQLVLEDRQMVVTLACDAGTCVTGEALDVDVLRSALRRLEKAGVDSLRVAGDPETLTGAVVTALVEVRATGMALSTSPRSFHDDPDHDGRPSPLAVAGFTPDPRPDVTKRLQPLSEADLGVLRGSLGLDDIGTVEQPAAPSESPKAVPPESVPPESKKTPVVLDGDLL